METLRQIRKKRNENTKKRKEKVHGNTEANQEKWIIKTIRKRGEKNHGNTKTYKRKGHKKLEKKKETSSRKH